MSRESKKRQLRRQIVPSGPRPGGPAAGEEEDSREVVQKAHRRAVRRRLRTAIILLILAALGAVLIYQFSQYHQYEDFQVVWEKNLTSQDGGGEAVPQADSGFCGYEPLGGGILRYTRDGMSYLDRRGDVIWNQSYEMKSPIVSVNGEYAAVADQQGTAFFICSPEGCQGQAAALLPILRTAVSGQGVTADQGATLSYALVDGAWTLLPGAANVGVTWRATTGVDQTKVLNNTHLLLARADEADDSSTTPDAQAVEEIDLTDIVSGCCLEFDAVAFEREALFDKRGLIPQIEPRYRYPYFSHIFDGGYSAGYYFYTWAAVLDKDVFEAFRESGDLFNKRIADDFRRKVLARGGSADGMTLYRDFRGKDPDKRPMLRSRGLWTDPAPADSLAAMPAPAGKAPVREVPVK